MDATHLLDLAAGGESLSLEFKSDRQKLSDRAIVEATACLANGPGGILLLGVEDDGTVTGAKPRHGRTTDPMRLQAMIANLTIPPLVAEVETVAVGAGEVVVITVGQSPTPIGTSTGVYTRRAMQTDGTPQCVPYPFHEMFARKTTVGEADYAALRVPGARWEDLDPLEFERLRSFTRATSTDGGQGLSRLTDVEIARALGVVSTGPGEPEPLAGALLLFGRPEAIRRHLPTHAVTFQVLRGTAVEVNAAVEGGLLRAADELYRRVEAYNVEEEIDAGLLRVSIPLVPREAVREVVANALVHRDYTRLGPVRVQLTDESLTVSNPGGFPEGITLDNFLRESRPRSPLLAGAFARAGLVERTGRGINRMFEATLRIGRDAPDLSRSSDAGVTVVFGLGTADVNLARYVLERERSSGQPSRLADLQVLHRLRDGGRLSLAEASALLQQTESETRSAMGRMLAQGLIEERGSGRGRRYHLSAAVYRALDSRAAYVRVRSFEPIQQEQMVLTYVRAHGRIARAEASELCSMSPAQASGLLRRLAREGKLRMEGTKRGSRYVLP